MLPHTIRTNGHKIHSHQRLQTEIFHSISTSRQEFIIPHLYW
uniref:Uncharacterized protein n=2 Tax=Anguilla anguilla TaxID=7936 RepID=A0A0E9QVM5_ANGAN